MLQDSQPFSKSGEKLEREFYLFQSGKNQGICLAQEIHQSIYQQIILRVVVQVMNIHADCDGGVSVVGPWPCEVQWSTVEPRLTVTSPLAVISPRLYSTVQRIAHCNGHLSINRPVGNRICGVRNEGIADNSLHHVRDGSTVE